MLPWFPPPPWAACFGRNLVPHVQVMRDWVQNGHKPTWRSSYIPMPSPHGARKRARSAYAPRPRPHGHHGQSSGGGSGGSGAGGSSGAGAAMSPLATSLSGKVGSAHRPRGGSSSAAAGSAPLASRSALRSRSRANGAGSGSGSGSSGSTADEDPDAGSSDSEDEYGGGAGASGNAEDVRDDVSSGGDSHNRGGPAGGVSSSRRQSKRGRQNDADAAVGSRQGGVHGPTQAGAAPAGGGIGIGGGGARTLPVLRARSSMFEPPTVVDPTPGLVGRVKALVTGSIEMVGAEEAIAPPLAVLAGGSPRPSSELEQGAAFGAAGGARGQGKSTSASPAKRGYGSAMAAVGFSGLAPGRDGSSSARGRGGNGAGAGAGAGRGMGAALRGLSVNAASAAAASTLDYGFFGLALSPTAEPDRDAEHDFVSVVRSGVSLTDPFPTARLLMPVTPDECAWTWKHEDFMWLPNGDSNDGHASGAGAGAGAGAGGAMAGARRPDY